MNSVTESALFNELEKIALGVQEVTQLGTQQPTGLSNVYGSLIKNKEMVKDPELVKRIGLKPGKDALIMAPKSTFVRDFGPNSEGAYKAVKQHELTHYLRGRRGKMARVGTPGLRGLASTAREELAAHLVPAMRAKSPEIQQALSKGVLPGTIQSVRAAYPGQRLRDVAMGGTLKRIAKLFRR